MIVKLETNLTKTKVMTNSTRQRRIQLGSWQFRLNLALVLAAAAICLNQQAAHSDSQPYPLRGFLNQLGVCPPVNPPAAAPVELARAMQDWKSLTADASCHTQTPQIGRAHV